MRPKRGFRSFADFGLESFEHAFGAPEDYHFHAASRECVRAFQSDVARANHQSALRLFLFEEFAETDRSSKIAAGENAGKLNAGDCFGRRATGRYDELVVGDGDRLRTGAGVNGLASRLDFDGFVAQAHINVAFLAEEFGWVNDEVFWSRTSPDK